MAESNVVPFNPVSTDIDEQVASGTIRDRALLNATQATQDNPDQSARANVLSTTTGQPPQLVKNDIDYYEEQTRKQLTAALIKDNPYLQEYANGHPLAASISNDDWGPLSELSDVMKNLGGARRTAVGQGLRAIGGLISGPSVHQAGVEEATAAAEEARKSSLITGKLIPDSFRKENPAAAAVYDAFLSTPLGSYARWSTENVVGPSGVLSVPFSTVTGYVYGATKQLLRNAGASEDTVQTFARNTAAMVESAGMTGHVGAGEPAASIIRRLQDTSLARETATAMNLAKPYFDKNELPPNGLHPFIDRANAIMSQLDAETVEKAADLAQKTKTYQREGGPEFQREHFLSLFPNLHIEVPAWKVQELYGEKSPEADDGLLGWVPEIKEQLKSAGVSGKDIEIPRDMWITHATPEVRKALRGDARWQPGGMTKTEADAALAAEPARPTPPDRTIDAIEGVQRVAGIDKLLERLSPTQKRGLDFRNIIPEGAQPGEFKHWDFTEDNRPQTAAARETTQQSLATFKLRDILPKLYREDIPQHIRVLSEFFGNQLDRLVGDTPVHVVDTAHMDQLEPGEHHSRGYYHNHYGHIVVDKQYLDGSQPSYLGTQLIMHEAEHAISGEAIDKFAPVRQYIERLITHTKAWLTRYVGPSTKWHDFASSLGVEDIHYALSNPKEFLAEAKSDPHLMDMFAQMPLSKELAGGIRLRAGTMWDAVRGIVSDMYSRIFKRAPTDTVIDAIFKANQVIEDIRAQREAPAFKPQERPSYSREPELPQAGTTRMEDRELFEAKALGMGAKVYRAMRDAALKVIEKNAEFRTEQAQKAEAERQNKEWKANEDAVRELVHDDVMHLPDIAADHFLRTGELFNVKYRRTRLDGRLLTDEQKAGLDPEHWNEKSSLPPDSIAEALGFQSGDQMVQALRSLKEVREAEGLTPTAHVNQVVAARTDREMKARYGNLEQNILDAAKEHVFGATQYEILHQDTLRLAEQGKLELTFTKDDVMSWARTEFAKEVTGRIDSTKMMQKVGELGRTIEGLEAKGEWDSAFKVAQMREVAFQVAKIAIKAEKIIEKFQRRADQFRRREPKAVNIEWSNPIQDILRRVGVGVNRTPEDIAGEYVKTGAGSLADFVTAQQLPDIWNPDRNFPAGAGQTLTVAPFLLDPSWTGKWKTLKWADFEAVHNSIESLYENGRKATVTELGGVKREREALITDFVNIMHEVMGSPEGIDVPAKKESYAKAFFSALIQMESLWQRLARGDPNNPFMKLNNDIMRAGGHLAGLERDFSKEFADIGDAPKNMMKTVENPGLFFEPNERGGDIADTPMRITRRNLFAILSNMGNPSNADKLFRGHGIDAGQTIDMWKQTGYKVAYHHPVMDWLFQHTTKEDWDRAQKLGDLFEKIFTLAENTYYDLGARPGPRIELRSIETPFGTYKGWYHPVIYDPIRPAFFKYDEDTGERKRVGGSEKLSGPDPTTDAGFYQVATGAGYQKGRTSYAAPLLLNFDAIPGRLKQMLNDIAMKGVIIEANKIFSDSRFQIAMNKTMGPEYTKLLKPYLVDIAGQRRYTDPLAASGAKVIEYFYQNSVATLIGFNPGVVLKHFPTALQTSANQVGQAVFAKEFLNTWFNPLGWKNASFAYSKSNEIPRRARNWRETLTGTSEDVFPSGIAPLTKFVGENAAGWLEKVRQKVVKAGATPVAWSDMASVIPMWNVIYKREMREMAAKGKVDEGLAIDAADLAVRMAHGSTATTARPAIMRNNFVRTIVPFYTFFNDILQRQYETAWRFKDGMGYYKDGNYQKGTEEMGKVARGIWAYVLFPAIVEQAVSPIRWDPDDDNYIKQGAEIIARDVASSWPIIRDIAGAMLSGEDPTFSIFGTAFRDAADFRRDMAKGDIAFDQQHAGKTIKHTAAFIGIMLGIMNAQMGRWGEFAHDYATGQQDPDGPFSEEGLPQWYRALRFGDIKERKR